MRYALLGACATTLCLCACQSFVRHHDAEAGDDCHASRLRESSRENITAVHEAGHALVAWEVGGIPVRATIIPDEDNDGSTTSLRGSCGADDRMAILFGGIAAEKEYFGHEFSGSSGDLSLVAELRARGLDVETDELFQARIAVAQDRANKIVARRRCALTTIAWELKRHKEVNLLHMLPALALIPDND